jgi:hypothetical protein
MRIPDVHRALVRRSQSSTTLDLFTEARARHAALGAFDSPTLLVSFMRRNEGRCVQERSDLVAALIAEAQRGNTADWLALLVLAFFPGLLRLRERFGHTVGMSRGDFTALAFECFCEAAVALPLATQGRCAVLNLMSATKRRFLRHIQSEQLRRSMEFASGAVFFDRLPSADLDAEQAHLAEELTASLSCESIADLLAKPGVCTCDADVALARDTYLSSLPLSKWVCVNNPGLSEAELRRTYERLRKRRTRIAARARDVSQQRVDAPLFPPEHQASAP